jgi:hypothetical protein
MKKIFTLLTGSLLLLTVNAQEQKKDTRWFKGMYLQWGYNTEWYTRSTLHFNMSNGDNFTVHNVKAHDSRDFDAIAKKPADVSIPQYNYRIGFYLNRQHTKAIELNFDHAKYIVTDGQTARITGNIGGRQVNQDTVLDPGKLFHFEHTDGANWLHINYVSHHALTTTHSGRTLLSYVWKAGAGINIPRTDFTWHGEEYNNDFHIAGYNISAEGGFRFYALKKLFIEATGKTGYVKYINALANTETSKGNRASHHFGYFEVIATLGWDINF